LIEIFYFKTTDKRIRESWEIFKNYYRKNNKELILIDRTTIPPEYDHIYKLDTLIKILDENIQ
jgi:hypothetical protein